MGVKVKDLSAAESKNLHVEGGASIEGVFIKGPAQAAGVLPGDILLTGTPAGVGAPKQTFLSVGDRVVAEIEKIGELDVTIQPEG